MSYVEWVQGNRANRWEEDEVEMGFAKRTNPAWHHLPGRSIERGVTRRTGATVLAVEWVAQAHRLRGCYP